MSNMHPASVPNLTDLDKARIRARADKLNAVELLNLLAQSSSFRASHVSDDCTIADLRDSLVARVIRGEIEEFALPQIPPADLATQQARVLFREIANEIASNVNQIVAAARARQWAEQWLEAHPED